MEGDGYALALHCEYVDLPLDMEPDAHLIYCGFKDSVSLPLLIEKGFSMNVIIKRPELSKQTHVTFQELKVGQMTTDQHGWSRLKITHVSYLCLKDDTVQVHPSSSCPAWLPVSPIRDVKITIEDV